MNKLDKQLIFLLAFDAFMKETIIENQIPIDMNNDFNEIMKMIAIMNNNQIEMFNKLNERLDEMSEILSDIDAVIITVNENPTDDFNPELN